MNKVKKITSYREPHMVWVELHLLTGKVLRYKYDVTPATKVRIRQRLQHSQDFEKYDHWELSKSGKDSITFSESDMPMLVSLDIDFVQSLTVQNQCESSECVDCGGTGANAGGWDCGGCAGVGWN